MRGFTKDIIVIAAELKFDRTSRVLIPYWAVADVNHPVGGEVIRIV